MGENEERLLQALAGDPIVQFPCLSCSKELHGHKVHVGGFGDIPMYLHDDRWMSNGYEQFIARRIDNGNDIIRVGTNELIRSYMLCDGVEYRCSWVDCQLCNLIWHEGTRQWRTKP